MEKMVKRLLSVAIALAMVISWLPTTALQAEAVAGGDLCACGCGETASQVTWQALSAGTLTQDGHYYLSADLALTGTLTVSNQVTLDLRGKDITPAEGTRTIYVNSGASLTILDTVGGGEIYGADITASGEYGGAIYVVKNATLNMLSGVVRDGKAARGGNIAAYGDVTIDGKARVTGGNAERGGNIYTTAGTTTITGYAKILDGVASSMGGNLYVTATAATLKIAGRATVAGGNCNGSANIASMYGNVVITDNAVVDAGATGSATSVQITGYNGKASTLTVSGGTVYGKTQVDAKTDDYVCGVSISGAPVIKQLSLATGVVIDPAGMTEGASVTVEAVDAAITGTLTDAASYAPYFQAYASGSTVIAKDSALQITGGCPCCGEAYSAITWTSWSGGAITESGHYRLSASKTITTTATVASGVTAVIDLNGMTLTASGTRAITVSGNLSIVDLAGNGKVAGGDVGSDYGGAIQVKGTLNLYSGTISGGKAARGGNIYNSGGNVYMYGGSITGGNATFWGGNIYQDDGTFTVYDGTIESGTAGSLGSNIYARRTKNTVYIYGGTLTGDIYMQGTTMYVGGGTISGGAITATQYISTDYGVEDRSRLVITGGSISNTISLDGSQQKPELVISGGEITGKITVKYAQWVYLSGAPTVSNLYLNSGVEVTKALDAGASVTITGSGSSVSPTVTANTSWSISGSQLTITGSGAMPNYVQDTSWTKFTGTPWREQADQITSVVINSGVTSIGNWAFYGLKNLTSVTIPSTVTTIGESAFRGCTSLKTVSIGNVTKIGGYAFYGCTALTSVTASSALTQIGDGAFSGCEALTGLTGASAVNTLGNGAFDGCTSLTAFGAWFGSNYAVVDGVLYSSDKTTLLQFPGGYTGSFTVPAGVTTIADSAFSGCEKLTNVTAENNVTTVGKAAFDGCSALQTISFGANVTSIGQNAMSNCDSMTAITVAAGSTSYSSDDTGALCSAGGTVLYHAPGGVEDYTVASGIKSIGYSAFFANNTVKTVTLSDETTAIGGIAFAATGNLREVNVPAGMTEIGKAAFEASGVTDVNYPGTLAEYNTITVAAYNEPLLAAKVHCTLMDTTSCGDGVTAILDNDGLLIISGTGAITTAPWSTYAETITTVVIEEGVTAIGENAFAGCAGLTNVTIPATVTVIGANAFNGCTGLATVNYGCTEILWNKMTVGECNEALETAEKIFADAVPAGITVVTLPTKVDYAVGDTVDPTGMEVNIVYNDETTSPADLTDCTVTGELTMPGKQAVTVTWGDFSTTFQVNVSASGVSGAVNWTIDADGKLTISGNGEMDYYSVAWSAYMDCITSVEIQTGVTGDLSKRAFHSAVNLQSVSLPEGIEWISATAFCGCTSLTEIVLPSTTTDIRDSAFSNCTNLKKITIGEGIEIISANAFTNCTALTDVYFAGTMTQWNTYGVTLADTVTIHCAKKNLVSVEATWTDAKAEYYMNEEIDLTGLVVTVTYDDDSTEETTDYTAVYDFTVAGTRTVEIQYQGNTVYSYEVTVLPAGVSEDGFSWNIDADGILTILAVVEEGGEAAAMMDYTEEAPAPWAAYAESITAVVIGGNIANVGTYAFADCVNLTAVSLPKSVTAIGNNAFAGCTVLAEVTYSGLASDWAAITVGEGNEALTQATITLQVLYGDVNGDGEINTQDTLRLMKYLAGWNVEIDQKASDVNGDGILNTKDSLRLMKYLADWDVTLGPQE